ncbi:MAG: anti-sigma factor, partial [Phormidesmis sp.]
AGLIVAMGFQNYGLRRSLQTIQIAQTKQPATESLTFSLAPAEAGQPGKVRIVVDPNKLSALVETTNLPTLETGKVYALWTVVADNAPVTKDSKNAILTAVLPGNVADNNQEIAVPDVFRDRALIKAVAVTVEDASAPQQHQNSPIFIQKL